VAKRAKLSEPRRIQDLELKHELRDPIHGLIQLTDQEMDIVNTSVFQRLRRIKQLALADLVYPGALHTRFEHLLGSLHVANRILLRLDRIEHIFYNDARLVRLAALLHDVGHGPFSHVSEYLLDKYSVKAQGRQREKIHESITSDIIRRTPELKSVLGADVEGIVLLIKGSGKRNFRRDIVSSSLDADKMDYLLRDAYYAGVQYGLYDLDKIIEAMRILPIVRLDESYLVISHEGLFAVEQLILAKHHMTQQVYGHRVRVITDAMIVRGLELAIKASDQLRKAYSYDGSQEQLDLYLKLDDNQVTQEVFNSGDQRAKQIFSRLRERKLFKELALIPIDDKNVSNSVTRTHLLAFGEKGKETEIGDLEEQVASFLGCEPWQVIIHIKSIKNPAYVSAASPDPEGVQILARDGEPQTLDQFDEVAKGSLPQTYRLHVIGPLPNNGEKYLSGSDTRKDLEAKIRKIIFRQVGGV